MLHVLPTLWCRNTWSWGRADEGCWPRPKISRRRAIGTAGDHHAAWAVFVCAVRRKARPQLAFHRERHECPEAVRLPTDRRIQRCLPEYVIHGRADAVNPATSAPRRRRITCSTCRPGSRRRSASSLRRGRNVPRAFRPEFGRVSRSASREADAFYARRCQDDDAGRRTAVPGRPMRGCCGQAVLSLHRQGVARRRSRRSRRRPRRARRAATAIGRICSTATSSRCRTNGSIPGSPPGISRFI